MYNALLIGITHKGKTITTTVGSTVYENFSSNLKQAQLEPGRVPAGFEHRPDLIANLFFGSPEKWWLICETNGIFDPFESLNLNDIINIDYGS